MFYSFVTNAFLTVIILTPLLGLLSTCVVGEKMSFFADSLGHSALSGVAIGILLGLDSPIIITILFSCIFAVAIVLLRHKTQSSMDVLIGIFSSFSIALGLVLLAHKGGVAKYSYLLVGDLYLAQKNDIIWLLAISILAFIATCKIYNHLVISPLPQKLWPQIVFAIVLAVIVSISLQLVGVLIISSLLILPGAAARLRARNSRQYVMYSIIISLVGGISGLFLSLNFDWPAGACIVIACSVQYFILAIRSVK